MRRSGSSLAGVVFFCLAAASWLTWLLLSLEWSFESSITARRRIEERGALSSQMESCRRWLRAELAAGREPRVNPDRVTGDPDSRRVFESRGANGAFAAVYDLTPLPSNPGAWGRPLLSCPGGFLIRASNPGGSLPLFAIEAVWVTRAILLPDGSTVTVLEEKPLMWRENLY